MLESVALLKRKSSRRLHRRLNKPYVYLGLPQRQIPDPSATIEIRFKSHDGQHLIAKKTY